MVINKRALICACLVLVGSCMRMEADFYIDNNGRAHKIHCEPATWTDLLKTVGVIGGIVGVGFAIKVCYDYFHWTDARIMQWAREKLTEIRDRYTFINSTTSQLRPEETAFIDLFTNFGLNTNSSMDSTLRAAGPLHSAVDRMLTDFNTLCSIIEECGKRKLVNNSLIAESLEHARLLEPIIHMILQTKEYKKEAVEIEKLKNSREQLHTQQAVLCNQIAHQLDHHSHDTVVIVEKKK